MNDLSFADRIRERYPEGLTGVFAVGGTRTTYILEQNRLADDPGRIKDFSAHGEYLLPRYWDLILNFFALGGQNMIITAFSFRGFYNRGQEYAGLVTQEMLRFINSESEAFYRENDIDPSFIGVEPLLLLPEDSLPHQVGKQLLEFQENWTTRPGRRKLIWEIASMPLYSFWRMFRSMSEEEHAVMEAEMAEFPNLEDLNRYLYKKFARAAVGTDVPMPHFYLGTNKSGDLKPRSPLLMALTGGDYVRFFFTPYPSLFITRDTLQTILEDLAFGDRFHSAKTDYSGQYSRDLVQAEYDRVMELSSHPETTLGLSRRVKTPQT